ncbi:5379_t:CDS:2, partial [Dentiscutata erythropus]
MNNNSEQSTSFTNLKQSLQQCLSHQYQQYQEYNRQLSESKSKKTRKRKSVLELQGVADEYHQYLQNHGIANDNKSKNKHAGNTDII